MARRSTTRYTVLGMLAIQPMSGYEMRGLIGETIGHFWSESYGQLYPTLGGLVDEGLATVETEEGEGKPGRKVYSVTQAGLDELRRWVAEPPDRRPGRNELLLKTFFGRHVPAARLVETVERARREQAHALEALRVAERESSPEDRGHPDFPYWMMTLRYGLAVGEAVLGWCDETLAALRRLEGEGRGAREDSGIGRATGARDGG